MISGLDWICWFQRQCHSNRQCTLHQARPKSETCRILFRRLQLLLSLSIMVMKVTLVPTGVATIPANDGKDSKQNSFWVPIRISSFRSNKLMKDAAHGETKLCICPYCSTTIQNWLLVPSHRPPKLPSDWLHYSLTSLSPSLPALHHEWSILVSQPFLFQARACRRTDTVDWSTPWRREAIRQLPTDEGTGCCPSNLA